MRLNAFAVDEMNHLILEAIKSGGLGNDGNISKEDVAFMNNYIVTNYKDEWANLYGKNNKNRDAIYYLGFKSNSKKDNFNKVALALDTTLKVDLIAGKLSNHNKF